MKILRFHQFVLLEKGPVNTAIIDFLKKNAFQVGNEYLERFMDGNYDKIEDLVDFLKQEDLIVEAEENDWFPSLWLDLAEGEKEAFPILHSFFFFSLFFLFFSFRPGGVL
ncbi:MAG: hypothetical protein GY765_25670 [bacterium]|nr:hypothetical protein [bacterium]